MTNETTKIDFDPPIKETAALFHCTNKHVYMMLDRGTLEGYKIGGATRVTAESINRVRSTPFTPDKFSGASAASPALQQSGNSGS